MAVPLNLPLKTDNGFDSYPGTRKQPEKMKGIRTKIIVLFIDE
jgi:hypothetical protein